MNDYLECNDETLCCGCRACEQVCNTKAIEMNFNKEGFLYPIIDNTKCIRCNSCRIACPINNKAITENLGFEEPIAYVAWSNNQLLRFESSSGGIFGAIAEHIIHNNGIVYGAAFDENHRLNYESAENFKDLYPLKVSKYIQANTKHRFSEIKESLNNNKTVFFTGTPCYVAGLKSFLKKEYNNLITADFICHGVPSQKLFDKYFHYLKEKYKGEITRFRFRDKIDWFGQHPTTSFYVRKNNKEKRKSIPVPLTSYFNSFLQYKTHRPSCYECQFRTIRRISDFTLADYWGVEKFHDNMDFNNGVSALIIHTKKGKKLINELGEIISLVKSDIKYAGKVNINMHTKSIKHPLRDEIYANIDSLTYKELDKKYFRPKKYFYTLFKVKRIWIKMKTKALILNLLRVTSLNRIFPA